MGEGKDLVKYLAETILKGVRWMVGCLPRVRTGLISKLGLHEPTQHGSVNEELLRNLLFRNTKVAAVQKIKVQIANYGRIWRPLLFTRALKKTVKRIFYNSFGLTAENSVGMVAVPSAGCRDN